ncbi:MAG TPA: DUF1552 domain-containing protein [Terriglobia bacterium]|nr:DUF1552 domain-containing protein [Terriglobia bacterium]
MIITGKALPRRAFLRGMGVALGLPLMEAMVPALPLGAAARQAGKTPVRLMFLYVPNGIDMENWNPAYTGPLTELPRILKPLQPYRDDVLMLSNLTHNWARVLLDGAGDHGRCSANYLTGGHVEKTDKRAFVDSPMSMDQLIASRIGGETRLPSLELGMEDPRQSGNCDSGYSCAYTNNLSWKSSTQPMPPLLDPRMVFERLFGASADLTPAEREQQFRIRKSILDYVKESASALARDLGATDKRKLDEYLTAIRSIETRIEKAATDPTPVAPGMAKPAGTPADFAEHFSLLADMVTVAFQADLTRVATLLMTREGTSRPYREIGISDGHHPLTHHGGSREKLAKVTEINEYHLRNFAEWVGRLSALKEGSGRLLDNVMLVYGAGLSDGNRHLHDDLPTVIVGRGGGSLKTGQRVIFRRETPFSNLHLSLMDRMGVHVEGFGDSSGRLSGLS